MTNSCFSWIYEVKYTEKFAIGKIKAKPISIPPVATKADMNLFLISTGLLQKNYDIIFINIFNNYGLKKYIKFQI